MFIGILDFEKEQEQDVFISLKLDYTKIDDKILCYQKIIDKIIKKYENSSIDFVEDLADKVAILCLDEPFVKKVMVKLEKRNFSYSKATSVGVEIERFKS